MSYSKKALRAIWRRIAPRELTAVEAVATVPSINRSGHRVILGVGSGRSGMRWYSNVIRAHENATGGCERFKEFEAFYRYVTFNDLPVDMTGFHDLLHKAVDADLQHHDVSVQYSPYFSFGTAALSRLLHPALVVHHLRRPEAVVNSLYSKGWYNGAYPVDDTSKTTGLYPLNVSSFYHNFGRVLPKGSFLEEWKHLTRVGKLAWFYATINDAIREQMSGLDETSKWTVRLEDVDQSFEHYTSLASALQLEPVMSRRRYLRIKGSTSNVGKRTTRKYADWSDVEKSEFERFAGRWTANYEALTTGPLHLVN